MSENEGTGSLHSKLNMHSFERYAVDLKLIN